jgi:uroporphyrinogen-III synthase
MTSLPLVLITRPEEQGLSFARDVEALGAIPLLDPLLTIIPIKKTDWASGNPPDGVVLTSSHALQESFPSAWQDVPVFVVGKTTADKARLCGARKIYAATGDFSELMGILKKKLPPSSHLVYLRGEHIRHSLSECLCEYKITQYVTYTAKAASALSPETVAAIKESRLHSLTVFSPRTAHILRELLVEHDLLPFLSAINLLSLSGAVLESLADLPWKDVRVAKSPESDALLAELSSLL